MPPAAAGMSPDEHFSNKMRRNPCFLHLPRIPVGGGLREGCHRGSSLQTLDTGFVTW